jgi:hypothetical protein
MLVTDRYADRIRGVLRCHDRVIIAGTLPEFGHAQAATRHLNVQKIRNLRFAAFAKPLRDAIRANAERLAHEAGVEIEYLRKPKALRAGPTWPLCTKPWSVSPSTRSRPKKSPPSWGASWMPAPPPNSAPISTRASRAPASSTTWGPAAVKMYDKFGRVLRLETVTNDVSFFKHYREVVHRDGSTEWKLAPVKKSIYSLPALAELLAASNGRYLEFLSSLDDVSAGARRVDHISRTVQHGARRYRGFNVLDPQDRKLFEILERGEFNISGFQNRDLRRHLPDRTAPETCRLLKRLRTHGLVKRIGNTYKYYLTKLGRRVIAAALAIREFLVIPGLARA